MTSRIAVGAWWARPALQLLLLVFVLFSSFLAARPVDAALCHFPSFVQTNWTSQRNASSGLHQEDEPRDWSTHVREQFTEIDRKLIVHGGRIETRDASSSAVFHVRVCVQAVSNDKYLVTHEEPGQRGPIRCTCLQFVQRSLEVFQLREGNVSQRCDEGLCGDSELRLNKWLVVDQNRLRGSHIGPSVPCPLSGGFSMQIFDKGRNEVVCDGGYLGELRFEGNCQPDEGLIFRFRHQKCIPQDMYMRSTQPVVCLVTWAEPSDEPASNWRHQFTLVRHHEPRHAYYWLLRTSITAAVRTSSNGRRATAEQGTRLTAYLFKDLVVDASNFITATRNYIRFDAVRDGRSQACVDDYGLCADHGTSRCIDVGSGTDYRLTCPATCGLCNATRPAVGCRLPPSWIGSWRSTADATVTVNETTVMSSLDADRSWNCIRWEQRSSGTGSDDGIRETMLVTDYDNGCRQRFRCAKVVRQSKALLYLHLSQAAIWPFVGNSREPLNCSAFQYAIPSIPYTPSTSTIGESGSHMVTLYNDDESVNCNIPPGLVEYAVVVTSTNGGSRKNSSCVVSLMQHPYSDGTEFNLDVHCENKSDEAALPNGLTVGRRIFSCLESSSGSTVGQRQQLLVVTRTMQPPHDDVKQPLICWLFPNGGSDGAAAAALPSFQMFVGGQCDAVMFSLWQPSLLPGRPHQTPSAASFVRTSRSSALTFPPSSTLTTNQGVSLMKSSPSPTTTERLSSTTHASTTTSWRFSSFTLPTFLTATTRKIPRRTRPTSARRLMSTMRQTSTLTTKQTARLTKSSPDPTTAEHLSSTTTTPASDPTTKNARRWSSTSVFQFDSRDGTTADSNANERRPDDLLNDTDPVIVGDVLVSPSNSTTSNPVAVVSVVLILAGIQFIAFCCSC